MESVLSQRPDLIILDLGLPDIDGVQVTRELREWSQTPIIILSVREAEEDKIAASALVMLETADTAKGTPTGHSASSRPYQSAELIHRTSTFPLDTFPLDLTT